MPSHSIQSGGATFQESAATSTQSSQGTTTNDTISKSSYNYYSTNQYTRINELGYDDYNNGGDQYCNYRNEEHYRYDYYQWSYEELEYESRY